MRHNYQSGYKYFKKAQRTYHRSSATRRFFFHFQMWGMLTLGLVLAFLFGSSLHHYIAIGAPIAGGLIGGGAVMPLLRPWQTRRCYKVLNGDPRKPLNCYIEVDDATFVSGIAEKSEGRFQRSAVCEMAEDNEIMLLFLGKKKFLYLPKAEISQEGLDLTREWLKLPGSPDKC